MYRLTINPLLVEEIGTGTLIRTDYLGYQKWLAGGGVPAPIDSAAVVRADRDARISSISWRYERHAREIRLGLTVTDNIATLDKYVKALADVPLQAGFPNSVTWPIL